MMIVGGDFVRNGKDRAGLARLVMKAAWNGCFSVSGNEEGGGTLPEQTDMLQGADRRYGYGRSLRSAEGSDGCRQKKHVIEDA